MSSTRQLAAIMFADISGYTALMQQDESQAIQLRDKFQRKLEEVTDVYNGRIIEFKGDGAMSSFMSAIEAVHASLTLQLDMQNDPKVPLRIGLHMGDVVMEGNTIYGDGVNIASRIETFAVPASILISGKVYDEIRNQKDIKAVSLGMYSFKNVRDAIQVFAISNAGIQVPDSEYLEGKGEKVHEKAQFQKCMVVLPFVNMSNDPEQEYFSDGLTEEIITSLSRLKHMRVSSRTTSMQFKNTTKDIKTIATEAQVNYVMEGSVRKQGHDLRITAQLIDATRDVHVWAETYRGTIDDIFDIQEKVSEKIVEALRVQLSIEERASLQKHYTDNTEAYQLYLQGRSYWNKRNEPGLRKAVVFFEKALEKDADYALAWAGLADTYSLMGEYTNISRREVLSKQMAAVNRALQLDNRLGEAHISLAISLMLNEWDWKNAVKEYELGLGMNPNYATGHHWYAECMMFMGNSQKAFEEINLAVELDPVSPGILKDKGMYYYYNRQYSNALNMGMMTLELVPNFAAAHRLMSMAYAGLERYDEAITENTRWGELTGNKIKTEVALAYLLAASGKRDEAYKIVEDILALDELGGNDYRGMALVFTALGEKDKAFEWFDKSYNKHEESLCSIKIDPKLELLHDDPRFRELLNKIGLDDSGSL